ncbi:MAG: divalent-cation tolerance protein CutA [Candidatus Aminicenantia bacterium]
MSEKSEFILVITTIPDAEKGEEIAKKLVEERVSACVTVIPAYASFYWWEEKIERQQEFILFIKTKSSLYEKLENMILSLHPYTLPEIIAIPIVEGSKSYLNWLKKETI